MSASEIVNVPEDWFPNELRLIDLVDDGIVVTGPSFRKVVATKGLLLEVKTSSTFSGKFIFGGTTEPITFRSTLPTFEEFFEIKFWDAAAKSSAFCKLNFIAPAFVNEGEISKPSPFCGCPKTSIWYPSKLILFP